MTTTFTRSFIRPHKEVEFYNMTDAFKAHIQRTYIDTGVCIRFRDVSYESVHRSIIIIESEWDTAHTLFHSDLVASDPLWMAENVLELEYNAATEITLLHKDNMI